MRRTLPIEIVSLVHHVELHKDGWWEAALQQILLAGIWLLGKEPTVDELRAYLRKQFVVELSRQRVLESLGALVQGGDLIVTYGSRYKITEASRTRFGAAKAAAESTEARVRDRFTDLVRNCCSELDASAVWQTFTTNS